MLQINAQPTLRSRYVANKPVYAACVNCKMPFTHGPDHPAACTPAMSRYPYCMTCMVRNAQDPYFVSWLKKLFGINDQNL